MIAKEEVKAVLENIRDSDWKFSLYSVYPLNILRSDNELLKLWNSSYQKLWARCHKCCLPYLLLQEKKERNIQSAYITRPTLGFGRGRDYATIRCCRGRGTPFFIEEWSRRTRATASSSACSLLRIRRATLVAICLLPVADTVNMSIKEFQFQEFLRNFFEYPLDCFFLMLKMI